MKEAEIGANRRTLYHMRQDTVHPVDYGRHRASSLQVAGRHDNLTLPDGLPDVPSPLIHLAESRVIANIITASKRRQMPSIGNVARMVLHPPTHAGIRHTSASCTRARSRFRGTRARGRCPGTPVLRACPRGDAGGELARGQLSRPPRARRGPTEMITPRLSINRPRYGSQTRAPDRAAVRRSGSWSQCASPMGNRGCP